MAATGEGGGKEEIKTQFVTREGTYKLMTLSEYTRPNRIGFSGQTSTPVKASFITLTDQDSDERICFNIGRELYFYQYKGVRKAADLTKPIDKRVYKGTFPTCHDFNQLTASPECVMLLVGFTAGQVQLIDPIKKDLSKIYNEERLIDKTKVTCIKWLPGSPNQFMVAHSSGYVYIYNEELPCCVAPPHYQTFKQGEGFTVSTCKTKSTRNPLYRWEFGGGAWAVNEIAFSPCNKYLAVATQDGYLRVFNYDTMEFHGHMKSYFGGLICCGWSPDGRYIVVGGEDDLVSVYSFHERRVVCRGQGHKSWVNVVSFDAHTSLINGGDGDGGAGLDFSGSEEDFGQHPPRGGAAGGGGGGIAATLRQDALRGSTRSTASKGSNRSVDKLAIVSYRFASVGQDTTLCLWDLTEDVLRQPMGRARASTHLSTSGTGAATPANKLNSVSKATGSNHVGNNTASQPHQTAAASSSVTSSISQKFATLTLGDRKEKGGDNHHDTNTKKEHKRNFSLGNKGEKAPLLKTNHVSPVDESLKLLGSPACPRLDEVPLLEPLVCKKIAHERLTALVFHEECIVTACQEGYVCTWARPGRVGLTQQHTMSSPQSQTGGSTAL